MQPLAAPTSQVGHNDIVVQMELRFKEDDPTSGSSTPLVEWRTKRCAEPQGRMGVWGGGSGRGEQLARKDLRDHVLRRMKKVVIDRGFLRWRRLRRPTCPNCGRAAK
jgi:hypothetical protein